jgi:AcrR family transcriptional regulator
MTKTQTRKSDLRRAELRETLLRLGQEQVATGGLASLRMRDLARDAGCAVGAIYNVFPDMTSLILGVNGETFARIRVEVAGAVTGHETAPPVERLILLSRAYLSFADTHHHLWRALFDIDLPDSLEVPDWYRRDLGALFAHIAIPVAEIFQDLSGKELDLMVRTLFSSVHGIVVLGLQNRISGVPRERVESMIETLLRRLAAGPEKM